MTVPLDHIAVAITSLEEGLKIYRDLLGLRFHSTEVIEEQKVKAALLMAGSARIELLEPLSEDSPVAKFIAKRGEGLHHMALRVENLEQTLDRLKKAGLRLIDEQPRRGAEGALIAFVHPAATGGVLLELVERP